MRSDEEILELAIRKAIANGWGSTGYDWLDSVLSDSWEDESAYTLIFNHQFAKSLWGTESRLREGHFKYGDHGFKGAPDWQYHLQQMVIAEDPIKYLGEHLDE